MQHRRAPLLIALLATTAAAQPPISETWTVRFEGAPPQSLTRAATTANGDLVAIGTARIVGALERTLVVRHQPGGAEVWTAILGEPNAPGHVAPLDVAVGPGDEVVVATAEPGGQLALTKLDANGQVLWKAARPFGPACAVFEREDTLGIAPDGSIFVSTCDSGLARYDAAGTLLWDAVTAVDRSTDIAVAPDGRAYVAGAQSNFLAYGLTAYDPNGRVAWDLVETGAIGTVLGISRVALFPNGDVLLASVPETTCGVFGVRLIRFAADGTRLWETDYPAPPCEALYLKRVLIDDRSRVYVAGNETWLQLAQFDEAGQLAWERSFDTSPRQGSVFDARLTPNGQIVLTGEARRFGTPQDADVQTVWYDADGTLRGAARFENDSATGRALAVQPCGALYVVGHAWPGSVGLALRYPLLDPADFNGDERVDLADLAIVLANFGNGDAIPADGDTDGDGQVTLADLAAVLAGFGDGCGPG